MTVRRVFIGDDMKPVCRKIAYASRREAVHCLKRTRSGGMNVYRCRHCGLWHLGHKHKYAA